jgi:WD40 repeat protein
MEALRNAAALALVGGSACLAIGGFAGCSKAASPADPSPTTRGDGSEKTASDAAPRPSGPQPTQAALPPGALAVIGLPVLSSPSFVSDVGIAGELLLSCGNEHARLWEWRTGKLAWNHHVVDGSLRCALAADGSRAAVVGAGASGQTEILIRVGATGAEARSITRGSVPVFSPDGGKVALGKGGVEVRDAATNKAVWNAGATGLLAAVDQIGALIVVEATRVVRYKAQGASPEVLATLPVKADVAAFNSAATVVAFSDGNVVGTVAIDSGAVSRLSVQPDGKVKELALSSDASRLALGVPGGLSVYDAKTGALTWSSPPSAKGLAPNLAFSADGKRLAFSDARGNLRVADADTGKVHDIASRRRFLGWTADGGAIVKDGDVRLSIRLETGAESPAPATESVANSPDWADEVVDGVGGVSLAYSSDDATQCGGLRFWIPGKGPQSIPKAVGCQADEIGDSWTVGPGLAVATNAATNDVWDLSAKKKLFELSKHAKPLVKIAISADAKWILVVRGPAPAVDDPIDEYTEKEPRGGTRFEVWSVVGKKLTMAQHVDLVGARSAVLSSDGSAAVIGWNDGTVTELDARTEKELRRIGVHLSAVTALALSPDGKLVAASDQDDSTIIWKR